METKIRSLNSSSEPSTMCECEICRDTEFITRRDEEGRLIAQECKCAAVKRARRLLQRSGLAEFVDRMTFDGFTVKTPAQELLKMTGMEYVKRMIELKDSDEVKPWMYVGGNPGAGKTHICTAVCGELIKNGIPVKYMQWLTDARRLKFINDPDEFNNEAAKYTTPEVLYIDDLFKQKYSESPVFTEADIRVAFTILNDRYNMRKPTIISSEWDLIGNLIASDEGTFSRVYDMCKGYTVIVDRRKDNNYRMRGI